MLKVPLSLGCRWRWCCLSGKGESTWAQQPAPARGLAFLAARQGRCCARCLECRTVIFRCRPVVALGSGLSTIPHSPSFHSKSTRQDFFPPSLKFLSEVVFSTYMVNLDRKHLTVCTNKLIQHIHYIYIYIYRMFYIQTYTTF